MTTQPASVVCQIQDTVATITLNRPPLNILDIPMIGELHEALTRVHSARDAKVLVIANQGKAGESIDAAEAQRIGLINKVFPAATFGEMTGEFIRKLTSLSGSTLRLTRRAVNRGLDKNLSEGIAAAEQLYLRELMPTEDAREGLNAFQEKRKPVWKNK
jgi:enoyl-CoA hydratase/carnithine racemase